LIHLLLTTLQNDNDKLKNATAALGVLNDRFTWMVLLHRILDVVRKLDSPSVLLSTF
jgi:hypothetical protein